MVNIKVFRHMSSFRSRKNKGINLGLIKIQNKMGKSHKVLQNLMVFK